LFGVYNYLAKWYHQKAFHKMLVKLTAVILEVIRSSHADAKMDISSETEGKQKKKTGINPAKLFFFSASDSHC